ncbi:MAG: type III-B CRISPR-associated protein Cas10/Cmr2 [Proteobacteria bacterium]|nr:type III-B CRISPR-associated protein Cas10/Cmr2 [Pseudomonadota bacterium]
MPRYLLAIAIGPVQDFIASARRTRDLWFGSYLLSEVSKAVARDLKAKNATLIFPAPLNTNDLNEDSSLNVANKLLAEVETDDPANLLIEVKQAAQSHWETLANKALNQLTTRTQEDYHIRFDVRLDLWNDQLGDLLEFFGAWALVGDGEIAYNQARRRAEKLLAARKNTRQFAAATNPLIAYGLPKSSLDGKRETVLPDETQLPKWVKRKLGLNPGEQLDCPGLVKRLGGDMNQTERFTAISRIALDPWLRQIKTKGGDLSALHGPLDDLRKDGLTTPVLGNKNIYQSLPFDGELLYPFRLEAQQKALSDEGKKTPTLPEVFAQQQDIQGAKERLEALHKAVKPFWKEHGEPCPYVAVLSADGDRMGKLLDSLDDPKQLRQVSQALAKFAQGVPGIVRQYRGHCIYAGGDDVLALVPLDQVLGCARALHDEFGGKLDMTFSDIKPSLSVGIGIGHLLETMGYLLGLARTAEKLAKGNDLPEAEQRDGLAIILEPRSGAGIRLRDRWTHTPDQRLDPDQRQRLDPDKRLQEWMAAFHPDHDLIPDKAPYQLRELARELDWAEDSLIEAEMQRILGRKRAGSGTRPIKQQQIDKLFASARRPADAMGKTGFDLDGLVQELLIARRLSKSTA